MRESPNVLPRINADERGSEKIAKIAESERQFVKAAKIISEPSTSPCRFPITRDHPTHYERAPLWSKLTVNQTTTLYNKEHPHG
jgi:hypothetical protein